MADDIVPLGFGGSGGGTNINNTNPVNTNNPTPANQANTGSSFFPAQSNQPTNQSSTNQTPYEWKIPVNGKIRLDGRFDPNFIEWDRIDLSKIKKVEDTKFRFILVIKNNNFDQNPILYTSAEYYNDIDLALKENNPYFSLLSFERPFVIEVSLDDISPKVDEFLEAEEEAGALVLTNLHITREYESGSYNVVKRSVDHYPLIRYIDWLVSPRDKNNLLNTILPTEELGVYNIFPTGSTSNDSDGTTSPISPSWIWDGQFISNTENQLQGIFKTDSNSIVTTQTFVLNQVSSTPTSYINTNLLDDAILEPELFKLRLLESQTVYHEFSITAITDITDQTSTYKFDVSILQANTATPIYKSNTPYKIEIKPLVTGGGGGNGNNPAGGL